MYLKQIIISLLMTMALFSTASQVYATRVYHQKGRATSAKVTKLSAVNINKADVKTLSTLKGLGPKKARAIVAYREEHGRFKSVEDLNQVKGIGKGIIARLEKNNPGRIKLKS